MIQMIGNRYAIKKPKVLSETLEKETIIINLETGIYYSINHIGGLIWTGMECSCTLQEIINSLTKKFPGEENIIDQVIKFVENLTREELIFLTSEETSDNQLFINAIKNEKQPYLKPSLGKHEDVKEMLLADPIHDVSDEHGWPKLT